MPIVFVPVNMQSLPALTMNRLVILQGIKFVQIIAWEHDIEHVHIVVFFMTDYSFGFRLRNWCWRRISDWVFGVLWVDYVFEVLLDLLLIFGAHQFIRDRKLVASFRVLLFFIIDKMTIALKWYVVVSFSFWWLLQRNHFFACFWAFLHDSHLHVEGLFTDEVIIGSIYQFSYQWDKFLLLFPLKGKPNCLGFWGSYRLKNIARDIFFLGFSE